MHKVLLIFTFLLFFPVSSQAEELKLGGVVLPEPACFIIRSETEHKVYGNIGTNYYIHPSTNSPARHRSNFRLEPARSIDKNGYPTDRAEFCSYGPFFDNMKLEVVLRTLFPVFSCYTQIDQGEIVIKSKRNASDSGYDQWAECFE